MSFLLAILEGKKLALQVKDVRKLNVPTFMELSVKEIYPQAMKD